MFSSSKVSIKSNATDDAKSQEQNNNDNTDGDGDGDRTSFFDMNDTFFDVDTKQNVAIINDKNDGKRIYLLNTLKMMTDVFEAKIDNDNDNGNDTKEAKYSNGFTRLMDTICHTAPEIVWSRWEDIYRFCTVNFNDFNNEDHKKILHIYNMRIKGYKKKYSPAS